jgi:hypothetical protein
MFNPCLASPLDRLHRQLIYPLGSVSPRSLPQGEPICNWLRFCPRSPVMDILHGSSPLPEVLNYIVADFYFFVPGYLHGFLKICLKVVFMSQYCRRVSRPRALASPGATCTGFSTYFLIGIKYYVCMRYLPNHSRKMAQRGEGVSPLLKSGDAARACLRS